MNEDLQTLEKNSFYEDDNADLPPADIVAYNELRSCADLNRMYNEGILEIQPEFQREIVWKNADQTRFIDSLIKQLPIPSMCFSLDYKTQKWQVIDGLQRMSSIIRFLGVGDWKLAKLEDIDNKISGKRLSLFKDNSSELNLFYLRVKNLSLPITVIRCDYKKPSHTHYLFTIFHRLNTGGMRLNNQEIRNCIYAGSFNNFLKECNENKYWVALQDIKEGKIYRFSKVELILRFFAFYDNLSKYTGRLARFLNDYMYQNTNINSENIDKKRYLFESTVKIVLEKISDNRELTNIPNTVFEAIMYGVAKNITALGNVTEKEMKKMYLLLKNDNAFREENLKSGLADKDKVSERLNAAEIIFSFPK